MKWAEKLIKLDKIKHKTEILKAISSIKRII